MIDTSLPGIIIGLPTAAQQPFHLKAPAWQLFGDIWSQLSSQRPLSVRPYELSWSLWNLSSAPSTKARPGGQEQQIRSGAAECAPSSGIVFQVCCSAGFSHGPGALTHLSTHRLAFLERPWQGALAQPRSHSPMAEHTSELPALSHRQDQEPQGLR